MRSGGDAATGWEASVRGGPTPPPAGPPAATAPTLLTARAIFSGAVAESAEIWGGRRNVDKVSATVQRKGSKGRGPIQIACA